MNNEKKIILGVFTILAIVLLTVGATVAWFSYAKIGTKGSTITSGLIKFHYEEKSQGLTLNDAMPMTDAQGKETNYFEFTITSTTSKTVDIPYYITTTRGGTGTNMDNVVKVYLTKVNGGVETPVEIVSGKQIAKVSELGNYISNQGIAVGATGKALYNEKVSAGTTNYNQTYRLRMWISDDAHFVVQTLVPPYCTENANNTTVTEINGSPATEANCTGENYTWHPIGIENSYPYNGKTYTLKVNVYGQGQSIPTISSCPDCVFGDPTSDWFYGEMATTLTSNQYKTNYEEVVAERGTDYFLGLNLDNAGTIEKGYACGILDETPFCIAGSDDGSTYSANSLLLNTLYGPYDSDTGLGCSDSGTYLECHGTVNATAYYNGSVEIADNDGGCYVNDSGTVSCYEMSPVL